VEVYLERLAVGQEMRQSRNEVAGDLGAVGAMTIKHTKEAVSPATQVLFHDVSILWQAINLQSPRVQGLRAGASVRKSLTGFHQIGGHT